MPEPSRGEVWSINLDPVLGREQGGTRPALVISVDRFNQGPADLVVVLPITSKDKKQPIHVALEPPEGGLPVRSFVKCDDVRSISKQRLKRRLGGVAPSTMREVESRLRVLLDL